MSVRAEGEGSGKYAITPTGDAEQGNYVVTFVARKLTVEDVPATEKETAGGMGVTSSVAQDPKGESALAAQGYWKTTRRRMSER